MKRIIYTAFIFSALFVVSCTNSNSTDAASDKAERAEPVRTMALDYQIIARTVDYTATMLAYEEIHLVPVSPGRIEEIRVEVGSRVNRGDLLVQMDRTQLHQAEIQLKTLETDFKRLDTLQKVGSIPQQQYDQMKAQLDITRSNVEFLKTNTQLKAPFSGVISGKYFESGEMYSGAPVPTIGKAAIVSLVQIDRLKVLVSISEKYFPLIKSGMETRITSDIYPDKVFNGKIFNIYPTIDPGTRSFNIEIAIDNKEGHLRPGMFGRVSLDLERVEAILLPAIAVLKLQGSNDRYLFKEVNGQAKRISVTLGQRYNDQIEVITDELERGDNIVVSGQARLLDGMKVEVIKDNQ
ncbi:MAG: efflux RND transporter periplasmic adaptor subunit [Bacteroidales bacterium]|nr:efflux RND transporter periplasmic adaptor subunit [Bacteroidales bacterium]